MIDNDERYNEIKNIKILLKDLKCKNKIVNISKKKIFRTAFRFSKISAIHQ